jgi:hypothetical protein
MVEEIRRAPLVDCGQRCIVGEGFKQAIDKLILADRPPLTGPL